MPGDMEPMRPMEHLAYQNHLIHQLRYYRRDQELNSYWSSRTTKNTWTNGTKKSPGPPSIGEQGFLGVPGCCERLHPVDSERISNHCMKPSRENGQKKKKLEPIDVAEEAGNDQRGEQEYVKE
ncbi:hypothetical protein LOAG_09682, partial [Loa loa]